MAPLSYYDTLGVPPTATLDQIKDAYRAMARANHPDKNQYGARLMQELNEAYATLSDAVRRREYDRNYRSEGTNGTNPVTPPHPPHPHSSAQAGARGSSNGAHGGYGCGARTRGGFGGVYGKAWEQKKEEAKRKKKEAEEREERRQRERQREEAEARQRAEEAKQRAEEEARRAEEEAQRRLQAIQPYICMGCNDIVTKSFWEASCCGRLICHDCLGSASYGGSIGEMKQFGAFSFQCPNGLCQQNVRLIVDKERKRVPSGWTKSSKFIQSQIDSLAPTHCCGRNVLPERMAEHEMVCPALNTPCFQCNEQGGRRPPFGLVCSGCNGSKFLKGKNWSKCFRCQGRGAVSGIGACSACLVCSGKGALEGIWSKCFKCQGSGKFMAHGFAMTHCNACTTTESSGSLGRGALWGYWARCIQCRGKGDSSCVCQGKGSIAGNWSLCFKCEGEGYVTTFRKSKYGHGRNACDSCGGSKMIQERNWVACHLCAGCGCQGCHWKGSERCKCGDGCQGHSPINV